MRRALAQAAAQLGRTAPNPSVGCVLARDGVVIAAAATGDGGRPHAEEQAVAAAGDAARGATAYVTLEPCARRSSGAASCTDVLIAAGVARVVIAVADPHRFADGAGLARLRAAGIEIVTGVCEAEAADLNAGFFRVVREGLPLVQWASGSDAARYERRFTAAPGEDLRAALEAEAAAGATRLYVDDPRLAAALEAAGLLSPPPRTP
ncbi:MAG: cytidine deaminase [Alphaproteobacteria bacterium]|nr:cytidine deaminase [Alphaproteobacteria bacterium]